MTTMSVEDAAKRAAEVEDTVAKIMRSMVDLEVEHRAAFVLVSRVDGSKGWDVMWMTPQRRRGRSNRGPRQGGF
jgi:hypothetical protein